MKNEELKDQGLERQAGDPSVGRMVFDERHGNLPEKPGGHHGPGQVSRLQAASGLRTRAKQTFVGAPTKVLPHLA